jgi:uncharacterized protein
MLIGVISDTHDRAEMTSAGLRLLRAEGIEALIHCGDVTSTSILDLLADTIPVYFVYGNNDWDRDGLAGHAGHLGITCLGDCGVVELGGKRIGVAHGDRRVAMDKTIAEVKQGFLLYGHTHAADDRQDGAIRYVNPGALHRTRSPSVCVIDLEIDAVRFKLVGG